MDQRTVTALKGSIAKWEAIVEGRGIDKGIDNCTLCIEFYEAGCEGCPVSKNTGRTSCQGSPYIAFSEWYTGKYLDDVSIDETERFKRLAQDELDFLRSLLPSEAFDERRGSSLKGVHNT